jgi:dihydroflavonol-4-reductase
MKTILVTGSTGFLGGHLVEQLSAAEPEAQLRLLSRRASRWDQDDRVAIVRGDITSPEDVSRAVAGATEVYHLAGLVSRDPRQADQLYRVHVEGTRNVCEAARHHGIARLLHVSSSGTIAVSREPVVHDEKSGYKHDVVGQWPYYLSKIFSEKLALSYFEQERLSVVVVNPSLLLGPGDEHGSSTGDVRWFLEGQIQALPLGGMSFVDARDAAAGLIAAMRQGRGGERYLLGGPNWTFREIIHVVAELSGRKAPKLQLPVWASLAGAATMRHAYPLAGKKFELDEASVRMSALFWYCDSGKAQRELGFTSRDPHETLRDTIADLRRVSQ